MRITETDKLRRDLEELEKAKKTFQDMRQELEINKRTTACWLKLMLCREITNINLKIAEKKRQIAEAEAEAC